MKLKREQFKLNSKLKHKILALLAVVPALILVHLSQQYSAQVDPFLRVVNLFGTLMHEAGHSLATLFTGGSLFEYVVRPDSSGHAMIAGGNQSLSLPAGYLSTTLITALMFLVNNRTRWGDLIPTVLGVAYILLTAVYGAKLEGGVTTLIVGYVCGFFLVYIGVHPRIRIPRTRRYIVVHDLVWMFAVNLVSLYYGLGGIHSLKYLSQHAAHGNPDDVSRFTDLFYPWMDPRTMATIWMWLSIAVWLGTFALIVHYFFVHRNEEDL